MSDQIKIAAKAVAALLAPILVAVLAGLLERAGIDVPVDPTVVETATVSVIGAVAVYVTRNRSEP